MADKPITREEKYLAYLTGDYTGEILKPITRKEKYLYELCLKGIGGEVSPEEIKNAVNEYLEKNPVKPGATTEQAQQIEQNKTDVASLKEETGSLKEDLAHLSNDLVVGNVPVVFLSWEIGAFDGSNGTDTKTDADKRIMTPLFSFGKEEDVTLSIGSGFRAFIGYFDDNNAWNYLGWKTGTVILSVNPLYRYRVQVSKTIQEIVTDVAYYVKQFSIINKALTTTKEFDDFSLHTTTQFEQIKTNLQNVESDVGSVENLINREYVVVGNNILRKNVRTVLLTDGTVTDGTSNANVVSDFINIENSTITSFYAVGAITLGGGNCAFVAFYTDAKEESFISSIPVSNGSVITGNWRYIDSVAIPNGAKYLRIAGNSDIFTPSSPTLSFSKNSLKPNYEKEPYTSDTIYFKIKVNQTFANNNSELMSNADGEMFADVWVALRLPSNYTQYGKPCKLAIFCHGAGEAGIIDGDTDTAVAFKRDSEEFVQAGYAVFDITGNNQEYFQHMGSMRSMSAYKKAYEYIVDHYNVEREIYVMGQSMGGLTALNFCMWNKDIVKACAVAYPVTDLKGQAWDYPWFGQGSSDPTRVALAREYNFDSYATYLSSHNYNDLVFEADKIKGFSPIENDSVVVGDDRYNSFPCPLKIIHGKADTTVSYTGTEALKTALKNRGCFAEIRFINDLTHTIYPWLRQELLMFISRY